jgi:hypothetical protein
MDMMYILAEAAPKAVETGKVVPLDWLWQNVTQLTVIEALTFMSFGAVCLFYGWRVFKILVIISFALMGLFAGLFLNNLLGGGDNPILGIIMAITLAIAAIPLMRWAVCILGAIAGGILTAGLWYALSLPETFIWAGALVGIVAGGMISFIVFRIAVMLFSSLAGATLLATGILALLYLYQPTAESIKQLFYDQNWFLPLTLTIPTALGVYVQHKLVKDSSNWSV